ncbi:hypothetical protein ACT453_53160, partial [Bacillus sp. D-CC]
PAPTSATVAKPATTTAPTTTQPLTAEQIAGVPTIVFGPGETKVAHYPNEYIEVDRMIDVREQRTSFIR